MSDSAVEVLRKASHEELELLIEFLDRPWDMMVKADQIYRNAQSDLTTIPDFIVSRIRLAGGHTVANWSRGLEGPSYHEVVADACRSQKVKVKNDDAVPVMELTLLRVLFERQWEKMTEAERAEFIKNFKGQTGFAGPLRVGMSFAALGAALGPALFRLATTEFAAALSARLALSVLGPVVGVVLGGPFNMVALGVVIAHQTLGPRLSATLPCVLHITSLRLKQNMDDALGDPL